MRGKKHLILKLPCDHGSIEIKDKAEDKYVVCPKCLHKYILHWSLRPKLTWNQ